MERRRFSRAKRLWAATISQEGSSSPCVVLEYSLGGIKVRLPEPLPLARGPVEISCLQLGDVKGTLVWQEGTEIGIKFD